MHIPVLLNEVIDALRVRPGEVLLDATVGSATHAAAIAEAAGGSITIIGIDEDEDALARAEGRLRQTNASVFLWRGNFRHLDEALRAHGTTQVHAILFDLGVSTQELLESGRGFSFNRDEPLLMTFRTGSEAGVTAREVVNRWSEESITAILKGFGEERKARAIARAIVAARAHHPIETSRALADIISTVKGVSRGRTHPATRAFQAIRMAVNDELPALTEGLGKALALLAPGGRLAVISFHSGEDRIVKRMFREAQTGGAGTASKKPLVPSREEVRENPRSRSAKVRIFIRNT